MLLRDATANAAATATSRLIQLTTNRTNLKGEFLLGRDAATSRFNSAYASAPAGSITGAPTFGVHKLQSVDYANYLDTLVADNVDLTIMCVVAPGASTTSDFYMGTGAASAGQVALYINASNLQFQCATSAAVSTGLTVATTAPTTPLTDFRAFAARASGTTSPTLKVDEFKGGVRTKGNSATGSATRAVDSRTITVGSFRSSGLPGVNDFAAALIWYELLSDAALLAAYLEVRTALSGFVTGAIPC